MWRFRLWLVLCFLLCIVCVECGKSRYRRKKDKTSPEIVPTSTPFTAPERSEADFVAIPKIIMNAKNAEETILSDIDVPKSKGDDVFTITKDKNGNVIVNRDPPTVAPTHINELAAPPENINSQNILAALQKTLSMRQAAESMAPSNLSSNIFYRTLNATVNLDYDIKPNRRPLRSMTDALIQFSAFKIRWGKEYRDRKEEKNRFTIFRLNLARIDYMNSLPYQSAKFGINEFADMTPKEFAEAFYVKEIDAVKYEANQILTYVEYIPSPLKEIGSFETNLGAKIYFQGYGCASSWAFAAMDVLKTHIVIRNNSITMFPSVQQVVNCHRSDHCKVGTPMDAYMVWTNYGVINATTLDYEERVMAYNCLEKSQIYAAPFVVTGWKAVSTASKRNENLVMNMLHQFGAVSVCFSVGGGEGTDLMQWFQFYTGGVITKCTKKYSAEMNSFEALEYEKSLPLDYCGAIVGYGIENGIKFWKVKISLGINWGFDGYLKIERGNHRCNIDALATIPVFRIL